MKQLIRQIKEGNKEAFRKLYDQYAEYTIRVAIGITKNKVYASEAVQETFIRVYKHIDRFDEEKSFEPWLYKILVNECHRILRNQAKFIPISHFTEENLGKIENDFRKFEEYEELYRAIKELDEIYRIPIILKYLKGFTEAEIAHILDLNVNTVKSRLFKGREKLRRRMEELKEGRNENE